jgi:AcrR family transcriptional regulator
MNNSRSKKAVASRLNPRKEPSQSRSARTVQAILEGAAHILEDRGLEGYTTNEIAARAGVSIGSLYQYFPGKDAVTISLIERESTTLLDEVTAALRLRDSGQALRAIIEAAVRNQLRRPELARLLDFEEARLAAVMPGSSNATAVRAAVIEFLQRSYRLSATRSMSVAIDVMEITRALTDAAGRQKAVDPSSLERAIEGAVLGYLNTVLEPTEPGLGSHQSEPSAAPASHQD